MKPLLAQRTGGRSRIQAELLAAPREPWDGLERPVFLYAGRVALEKNIEAFLALDLPGEPPLNTYTDAAPATSRFYQIRAKPLP